MGEHALIGLGSNLGDPVRELELALAELGRLRGTRLLARSRLYRTPPWGLAGQPDFVNAVAEVETSLGPRELLEGLLGIERARGRRREGPRWGPRVLDLDLLAYGSVRLDEPGLRLPHPRLAARAFVLLPLAELGAQRRLPGLATVGEMLAQVDAEGCVPLEADRPGAE